MAKSGIRVVRYYKRVVRQAWSGLAGHSKRQLLVAMTLFALTAVVTWLKTHNLDEQDLVIAALIFGAYFSVAWLVYLFRAPARIDADQQAELDALRTNLDVDVTISGVFAHESGYESPFVQFTDLRITNRMPVTVSLEFTLLFPIGTSTLEFNDNPIGQARRRKRPEFAHMLDNPVTVHGPDTTSGDLGFLLASFVEVLDNLDGPDLRLKVIAHGRLRIVDHISRQKIEIPARRGTYTWNVGSGNQLPIGENI